jgi:hypothetical protein
MAGRPRRHLPARSAVDQSARPICDISRHSSFIVITIVTPHHALKFQGCVESHSPNLTGVLCRPWPCCWVEALLGYRIRSSDRVGVDGARRQSFKRSAFHQCLKKPVLDGKRYAMFKEAFLILSASAILATGVFAPTSTLAQLPGPPPLPGPAGPPHGLGGPPPGLGGPPPQLGLGGLPRPPGPGGTPPRPLERERMTMFTSTA